MTYISIFNTRYCERSGIMSAADPVYRILDANLNRLREALRVIEEYFRFIRNEETPSIKLKELRHRIIDIEQELGQAELLQHRDTERDCFANVNRSEELDRKGDSALARANFKRAQEASRVIEEYSKIGGHAGVSEKAKEIRFVLYKMEKETMAR